MASWNLTHFSFWFAAKLSVLLHVRLLNDYSMHICLWVLLGVNKENNGCGGQDNLEGNDHDACLHSTDNLHVYCSVVCWWPYSVSFVSHWHKPGNLH